MPDLTRFYLVRNIDGTPISSWDMAMDAQHEAERLTQEAEADGQLTRFEAVKNPDRAEEA